MGKLGSFVMKKLIETGVRIGVYGKYMLSYCIKNKMVYEAKMLIDNGIGIDVADKNGDAPLHIAIKQNMDALACMIISRGCNINIVNGYSNTPLHIAVNKGNIEMAKRLIKKNAIVNVKDRFFRTPLHYAAVKDDVDMVKLLIDNGAYVDARDLNGETALYRAVKYRKHKVEGLLLKNTKDINISNKYGCNLLHIAIQQESLDIVPKLISKGIYINKKNVLGETPLVVAVTRGNVSVSKLLVENGADMDVRENLERVELLDISVHRGSKNMMMLLLKSGANVTNSFVRWATKEGDIDILRGIEKRVAIDDDDVDKLKKIIQSEIRDNVSYDNRKLLEIAIRNRKRVVASVLMQNLINNKFDTLRELVWNKDIKDTLRSTVSWTIQHGRDVSTAYAMCQDRKFFATKLILDCIYEGKAKNINRM